jgi:putative transcription factor
MPTSHQPPHHQDHKQVVFHNKNATISNSSSNPRIVQHKNIQGNPSAQRITQVSKVRKLEDSTTSAKFRTVSKSFSQALLKARSGKKMTQIDLARATNQPLVVIKHYESGKAIPNGQIINKLNRVLGVCLPSTK